MQMVLPALLSSKSFDEILSCSGSPTIEFMGKFDCVGSAYVLLTEFVSCFLEIQPRTCVN